MKPHNCLPYLTLSIFPLLFLQANAAPPVGHPSPDDAASIMKIPQTQTFPHSGRVVSSIHSNSYTYIQVKMTAQASEQAIWLAAPRTNVVKGQRIAFPDGTLMRNFYSRKLKRTFPGVLFIRGVEVLPEET